MSESSNGRSVNKSTPGSAARNHNEGEIQMQRAEKVRAKITGNDAKGLAEGTGNAKADKESKVCAAADKWKLLSFPQFRGIDERAEEFIAKVRQNMKLEREQSKLDFQEMLRRSA